MNYEDRTDLLPPKEVVSAEVLARLQRAAGNADLVRDAATNGGALSRGSAPYQAIALRARESSGLPELGAPSWAEPMELDAMLCGYRLGRLALGESSSGDRPLSALKLRDLAESMYLHDLPLAGSAPVMEIASRHVVEPDGAHEETVWWAWGLGLGVAASLPSDATSRKTIGDLGSKCWHFWPCPERRTRPVRPA